MLNYRINIHTKKSFTPLIIFIHGLFGDLSNFNTLSRALYTKNYNTLQIDLRNHGKSPHSELMNYKIMSKDVFNLLDDLSISECIVIGHSMGGKVAMTLPLLKKHHCITKMIIIDIAPITYSTKKHSTIFKAINYVNTLHIKTRNEAFNIMNKFITNEKVIFFC